MNATGQEVDTGEKKGLNGAANEGDPPDFEALATELGWAPEEKFRGDKKRWVDAKTYYEKGSLVLPIVKQQRDEAKAHAEKADKKIAEMQAAMADFQKLTEAAAARQVTELQAEIATLKSARAAAVAAGDDKAFQAADDALDAAKEALTTAKKKPAKTEPKEAPKGDPDFEEWVAENDWYTKDRKRKIRADIIGANLIADDPNLKGKALFKAVSEEMERVESELSGTERPGPQRGGKASGANSKAKTFDNMQPEFKEGYARLTRAGIKQTKEQYVARVGPEAWGGA